MPPKSKRRASAIDQTLFLVTNSCAAGHQIIQLCAKGETALKIRYSVFHLHRHFIFHRRVLAERRHADGGAGMLAALAE